jgi:AcrR family transcriptional regulator
MVPRAGAERAGEARCRLINAAIEGTVAHGYDRVRLRDIAAIAGVTTGMIQHHFASREELLLAMLERLGTEQIEAARRIGRHEPDPWRRLEALIGQIAADSEAERHCVAWLDLCASAARDVRIRTSLARVTSEWRKHLTETVRDGLAAGVFTPILDEADVVDVLLAAIDGCELSVGSGAGVVDGPGARRLLLRLAAKLTGVRLQSDQSSD